ncbi:MAG: aldehyde ferredoxin oxidoreductase C-terminal domain-containing protein, partial [Thermus sp.]
LELLEVGERTLQLTRLFNLRHGIGPEEDRLPERFFQPFRKGNPEAHLDPHAFREGVRTYWRLAGWEEGGVDPERLRALGLEEFAGAD